ncbi:MAG TPA: FecR domain-containing protein [Xanthobacteraceae bacterium]|nr:FecR domain-containing protein [Xanthobacteraceae bacterium]
MAGKIHSVALTLAIALVAAAPAVVQQGMAQQIGTATAVNPSTEGTPPGGSTTTLTIGARVLHKERIHTSPTGSVQLLFLDKSTLSIAPNTSLVIDEFVYDPASKSGHMLTKLTQGTLQYIGGELSHQGAVTVQTPAAVIGIRGGIGIVSQGPNGAQALNLNGHQIIQNGAGTTNTITGYMVKILNWTTPAGPPFPIPPDLVLHNITILSSVNGQTGGGPPFNGLATTGFACGTYSTPPCPQPPWLPTNTGENDALQIIIESTQRGSLPNPPPPPPPTNFSPLR